MAAEDHTVSRAGQRFGAMTAGPGTFSRSAVSNRRWGHARRGLAPSVYPDNGA